MKYISPAKCILSGEHSVLRGGHAIAFPIQGSNLGIEIIPANNFDVQFTGSLANEARLPFSMALEKALDKVGKTKSDLHDQFIIENTIPLGSGLGASASICVAVAKVFIHYGWLHEDQAFEFSKNLEDVFHGESSGLDVAVSLNNKGILFHREKGSEILDSSWKANLYLTYSGNRGLTADCVKKVKDFIVNDPDAATSIDHKMRDSVHYILKSIRESKTNEDLIIGMNLGRECFSEWGLINANMREHMQVLGDQGAIAMKPTGSGDGGYILSLWPSQRRPLMENAISLF